MRFIPLTMGALFATSLAAAGLAQSPRTIAAPDDNSFANQAFSSTLLQKIPQGTKACRAYQGNPYCSYKKRYIFKDIVLLMITRIISQDCVTSKLNQKPKKPYQQELIQDSSFWAIIPCTA